MKPIAEVYPERQGRPVVLDTRDLETGQPALLHLYIALKEEYSRVEKLFEERLSELIQKMEEQTLELKKIALHLAGISDEPIDEESIESLD